MKTKEERDKIRPLLQGLEIHGAGRAAVPSTQALLAFDQIDELERELEFVYKELAESWHMPIETVKEMIRYEMEWEQNE